MTSLKELFANHQGRIIHKWTQYIDAYEEALLPYKTSPVRLLEIGLGKGGSLQLWEKYFPNREIIFGVDINSDCLSFRNGRTDIIIGDQGDPLFLDRLKARTGKLDIIIDDGSHRVDDQILTFRKLFPSVRDGGLYIVEDMQTSYNEKFGGGVRKEGTFVEYSKNFIDYLNLWFRTKFPENGTSELTEAPLPELLTYTRSIRKVVYYPGMMIIYKDSAGKPTHVKRGYYDCSVLTG
jgi:SAM-dependent methyltransferase